MSNAVSRYAEVKEDKDEIAGKVNQRLLGKTAPEIAKALKEDPELQSKLAQKQGAAMMGLTVADETIREAVEAYQTGASIRTVATSMSSSTATSSATSRSSETPIPRSLGSTVTASALASTPCGMATPTIR